MVKRIIRIALDIWDFVIVELVVEGNWNSAIVKYRGVEIGAFATGKELDEGAFFILPDGGSLHVVLCGTVVTRPRVTLNNTKLCAVMSDPFRRVRNASKAALILGGLQIVTFFWFLIQLRGNFALSDTFLALICGI